MSQAVASRAKRAPKKAEVFVSKEESYVSLDYYLDEITREQMVSPSEEVELAKLARAGDERAVEKLIRANLRFVIMVAKKYRGTGVPLADLIQEGNAGLVTAAKKFDPDQGVKFISYAVWWIRQAILASLANHSHTVRIPLNRATELNRYKKAKEALRAELRREPSTEELVERTGISEEMLRVHERLSIAEVRLDAPLKDDADSASLLDRFQQDEVTTSDQDLEIEQREQCVIGALEGLPEREKKILRLYYGFQEDREYSLEEIGDLLGITRERVRQLRNRALERLREGPEGGTLMGLM